MSDQPVPACAIEGMLTIHQAATLREHLQGAYEAGADTLDLHGVTDCDTAGLQLLLAFDRSLQGQGRRLHLSHAPPAVVEVLQRCGLQPMLG